MTSPQLQAELMKELTHAEFVRASFAGRAHGPNPNRWQRVQVRRIRIQGIEQLQFSYFDGKKTHTKNCLMTEIGGQLAEIVAVQFRDIHLTYQHHEANIRVSRQGSVHISRKALARPVQVEDHNRIKNLPLPEGVANPVLEQMGILTASGQVRPSMRAKYIQINEFLKHFNHVADDADFKNFRRPVEILDCGCGAAYLTIALHHYLNDILHIPARVIGVDMNPELIQKVARKASAKPSSSLNFISGKIGELTHSADVVVALHACNTATDDAITQAIRSQARLFLGVPCCHQELNQLLRASPASEVFRPLLRHGIFRERTAELLTDTLRALRLRINGYRTEVVEFTSPEHTARNVMIRAVAGLPKHDPQAVRDFQDLMRFWGFEPANHLSSCRVGQTTAELERHL